MVPWLALFDLQKICLLDSSPDWCCGSLVCFVRLSVHWLNRFVSRLLRWLLGLICLLWSLFAYEIRLPMPDTAFWLALYELQYTGSLDLSSDCWCGSLACFLRLGYVFLLDLSPDCLCRSVACFVWLAEDLLTRFVSWLLTWLLGLLCSTCSTVHWLWRYVSRLLM